MPLYLVTGSQFGGQGNFIGMFRGIGYAAAPVAVGVIPFIGAFVGGVWAMAATVVAVREIHKISTGKAVATVLIVLVELALILPRGQPRHFRNVSLSDTT